MYPFALLVFTKRFTWDCHVVCPFRGYIVRHYMNVPFFIFSNLVDILFPLFANVNNSCTCLRTFLFMSSMANVEEFLFGVYLGEMWPEYKACRSSALLYMANFFQGGWVSLHSRQEWARNNLTPHYPCQGLL